ncbi:response regulator [Geodermatophilus sabuli]|uniref:Transcriptional regulatory protein n=1 Tax=Geodermatophilus sabuli TaxID=1564158 RepID=A0A285EHA2_9ACTN|nr:response regulator [Geodermatophilus sabuli]MBB3083861.1 response regulator of citrate/malate metabolism [Geodermatophilus sabuli]SNX98512.1 Response regulator of citrate/malate metabolism [Geodermatophilus sabuli]
MTAAAIRVLVVEDEPVAAEAHRAYVDRTPGFDTVAVAGTGATALDALARVPVDLVLLDMNLPDTHGIELCRRIRAAGAPVDVLAVTSARELATVRAAAAHGVVGYLLKPFTYPALRDRLTAYAEYRARLSASGDAAGQDEVDRVLGAARPDRPAPLPKGMGRETLDAVVAAVRAAEGLSAAETGELIGASRITARRYLEYLADTGLVDRAPRYGGAGRPELEYRWR